VLALFQWLNGSGGVPRMTKRSDCLEYAKIAVRSFFSNNTPGRSGARRESQYVWLARQGREQRLPITCVLCLEPAQALCKDFQMGASFDSAECSALALMTELDDC